MLVSQVNKLILCIALALFSYPVVADAPIIDTAITSFIKAKIAHDPKLANSPIMIETNNGVVTLIGTINTENDASALIRIAESVHGVKDVDTSKLKIVRSKQPLMDMIITAKVKGLFIREKLFGAKDSIAALNIKVETNNGVVQLSGTADSELQANNAVKLTKSINGVKGVESKIIVTK